MDNVKRDNFYCNQIQIAVTPWDIIISMQRMALALDDSGKSTGGVELADELQVSMSLGHAKLMLAGLYQQIDTYEKNIIKAKIPLDDDNQKKYDVFIASVKSNK